MFHTALHICANLNVINEHIGISACEFALNCFEKSGRRKDKKLLAIIASKDKAKLAEEGNCHIFISF